MEDYINTDNKVVDINLVVPNAYNPKLSVDDNEHNYYEYEKILSSLQVAGQITPVIVRELEDGTYEIINGFHRHRAMKELGFGKIEIKNLGKIDLDTAISRALLTEDTKVPIDNIELAGLLKRVVTNDKPIEYWANLLPYTPDMIKQKIEMIDFDFGQYDNGEESDEGGDDKTIFKFKVESEEEQGICNQALDIAKGNRDEAFVTICSFYLNNNK